MDKKKEYLKQIAQEMVEHLPTMPDNISISTREMLTLMGGSVLREDDLFDLDDLFRKKAQKKGYIVDMSEHTGLAEGLPYNLDATFRNKKALLSKFASLPEKEVVTSDGGRYYIKEFVETYVGEEDEEGKSFTEERLLQLYIIPPHQSTGKIVAGKHRITFYTIRGKGDLEYIHENMEFMKKLYYNKTAELFDFGFTIKNTSDKNLVLFVVDIDDSQYFQPV